MWNKRVSIIISRKKNHLKSSSFIVKVFLISFFKYFKIEREETEYEYKISIKLSNELLLNYNFNFIHLIKFEIDDNVSHFYFKIYSY
jgi:hypothetical protein